MRIRWLWVMKNPIDTSLADALIIKRSAINRVFFLLTLPNFQNGYPSRHIG